MKRCLAVVLSALFFVGCGKTSPRLQVANAKPKLNLLRLTFDKTASSVDLHTRDEISLQINDCVLSITPIDGQAALNVDSALRGVVRRGGSTYRFEATKLAGMNATLYRYLRDVQSGRRVAQGDYLIELKGHWLLAVALGRSPGEHFDESGIEPFFQSIEILNHPQSEQEVPPAWKEYQETRLENGPLAKFIVYMDPAPILLGNYSQYLAKIKTDTFIMPTKRDFARGGRMIGPELLEFYSKDDPSSVRVDVWLNRTPPENEGREEIFSDKLLVNAPQIFISSFGDPCSMELEPGTYHVDIVLANRGMHEESFITDRDWFQRDDLERYEIYLNGRYPNRGN